jgi:hypothetical protein
VTPSPISHPHPWWITHGAAPSVMLTGNPIVIFSHPSVMHAREAAGPGGQSDFAATYPPDAICHSSIRLVTL